MITHEKNSDDRFDLNIKNRERRAAFSIIRILITSVAIALFTAHCDNKGSEGGSGGASSGSSGGGGSTCTKVLAGGRSNCLLSLTAAVTTLAGSSQSFADGTGTDAAFNSPSRLTSDGTNLYVTDPNNHRIRKIVIATGVVTTLAGGSRGSSDGTGTAANFSFPSGITTDGTSLYVADKDNHRIRRVVIATREVTTLAGNGFGDTDGTGTAATFKSPSDLTTDGINLYVADTNSHRIRKIVIATGVVTTLAGSSQGSANGTGTAAMFDSPAGITIDGSNLFVGDTENNQIRKIVIATGAVTTLAGNSPGDADGIGVAASFYWPKGLTTDGTNLFVADDVNNRIRKIVTATGVVTTLAGGIIGFEDNTGTNARFSDPSGVTTDGTYLYVADMSNHRIRKIQ